MKNVWSNLHVARHFYFEQKQISVRNIFFSFFPRKDDDTTKLQNIPWILNVILFT